MMQDQDRVAPREALSASGAASAPDDNSPERFLNRFDRVPSGLDPSQVYNHFITTISRIKQLEEQASRVSAPFLIESALRDAAEIRTQASQSAERAYNAIVKGAEEEAERLRGQARAAADASAEQTRATVSEAGREADQVLAQARAEADQIRQQAQTSIVETEQELEQLVSGFLQRLRDRRETVTAIEAPIDTTSSDASSAPEPTGADEPPARESSPSTPTPADPPTHASAPSISTAAEPPAAPSRAPTPPVWRARPAVTDQPSPSPVAAPAMSVSAPVVEEPQPAQPSPRPLMAAAFERARDQNATEPPSDVSRQDQPATSSDQPTPPPAEKKESSGFKLPSWLDL